MLRNVGGCQEWKTSIRQIPGADNTTRSDLPVVVFSNFPPLAGKLSEDRLEIVPLEDEETISPDEEMAEEGTAKVEEVPMEAVPFTWIV